MSALNRFPQAARAAASNTVQRAPDNMPMARRRLFAVMTGLITSAGLLLFAPSAMAHDHVDWSIGVGIGAPPVVYQQPEIIYSQPSVIYEEVPVVQYRQSYDWHREHEWREHERREHEWREHEWREHHGRDRDGYRGRGGWGWGWGRD